MNNGKTALPTSALLVDDGELEWYTVFGFWFESWERWAGQYQADTPRAAEEMAQAEAAKRCLHLGVVAVVEGRVPTMDGYATFIDPTATSIEEIDEVRREHGYWYPIRDEKANKKKSLFARR